MNVKVITRHGPSNYGSLLQSIATIRTVERLGHECEIIDYMRDDERGLGCIITELNSKPGWNGNLLKRALYIAIRYPIMMLAQKRFDRYRKKYLKLTPRVSTHQELAQLSADAFITGSDQVWGPIGADDYDTAYLLDFVTEGKKVAYAASFGHTTFNEKTQEAFRRLLPLYHSLAVRENHAVDIVKDFVDKEPAQVLDPTLLLTASEWMDYVQSDDEAPQEKYILVYQIHNNPQLDVYASRLSETTGLPLYRMSPYLHQRSRGGKFIFLPTIGKFIMMIKHAAVMVTDSFHGTAFAINLNTPFVEILPGNGTNSRNQSILRLTGLQNRIVTDYNDFAMPLRPIDFNPVNAIIAAERKKSIRYLAEALGDADDCVKATVNN